jgi:hypothetical protein
MTVETVGTFPRRRLKLSIPPVDQRVREYLLGFGLGAIALTRDGRLISTTRVEGVRSSMVALKADEVGAVLKRARADQGDVLAAARELGVKAVEHSAIVQRTEMMVAKLNSRLAQAQRSGDAGFFHG